MKLSIGLTKTCIFLCIMNTIPTKIIINIFDYFVNSTIFKNINMFIYEIIRQNLQCRSSCDRHQHWITLIQPIHFRQLI